MWQFMGSQRVRHDLVMEQLQMMKNEEFEIWEICEKGYFREIVLYKSMLDIKGEI